MWTCPDVSGTFHDGPWTSMDTYDSMGLMADPRGGFGVLAARCFTGSMFGQPPLVFAVWCYCIANAKPVDDEEYGDVGSVELNPTILAAMFGGVPEKEVCDAIEYLESADPDSTTKDYDGKRLVKVGQFERLVLNLGKYRPLAGQEVLRERWREDKAKQRSKSDVHGQSKDSPHLPSTSSSQSKKRTSRNAERPADVSEEVWSDWLDHRRKKRASTSETVLNGLRREGEKAGLTLSQTMEFQVVNGWQGFQASWMAREGTKRPKSRYPASGRYAVSDSAVEAARRVDERGGR